MDAKRFMTIAEFIEIFETPADIVLAFLIQSSAPLRAFYPSDGQTWFARQEVARWLESRDLDPLAAVDEFEV